MDGAAVGHVGHVRSSALSACENRAKDRPELVGVDIHRQHGCSTIEELAHPGSGEISCGPHHDGGLASEVRTASVVGALQAHPRIDRNGSVSSL